jgi:hypothetical protein
MTTDTTPTELGEAENGDGHTDQDNFGDLGLDCNPFDDFSHEDFGGFDDSGDGDAGIQSSGLDFSNPYEFSSGPDFELTDTENSIIQYARRSIAGKRGRTATKKSENVYVTHEDFEEGAEQEAFLLIYGYAAVLFNTLQKGEFNEDNKKQQRAIDFFFCRTIAGLHLQDAVACIDAEIRTDVLRLRFMYEFWMREWVLPPMPSTADDLPSRVELMAAQYESMIGVSLAREAWFQPGVNVQDLFDRVTDGESDGFKKKAHQAFVDLVDNYVLSVAKDKVYVTGKNPMLELEDKSNDPAFRSRGRLANLYWSRKF